MPRKDFTAVRDKFARDDGLPFGRLLSREYVLSALEAAGHQYRNRVFCPLTVLWGWLSQCLSQDKSLNEAVARILAHRATTGLSPISPSSASYSNARRKFPEAAMQSMAYEIGQRVHDSAPAETLWRGRQVYLIDGTGLSMPDTPENQLEYPQPKTMQPGVGFPLLRASALISLATGAVVDMAFTKHMGKGTGESSMFMEMVGGLKPGDVVVGDKLYGTYAVLGMLVAAGVDAVTPIKEIRKKDGSEVVWERPGTDRSNRLNDHYAALPENLTLRQLEVEVEDRDGGTRIVTLVTTITDPAISDAEIADLYRQRWNCEVDFRSIKISMQLDIIRAKTPDMVRKEIWCHILAYNLLRGVMLESATKANVSPRQLSVKGALQLVESFTPVMMHGNGQESLYDAFLGALSAHRVGNRPGRIEPRVRKRRPKSAVHMSKPRNQYHRRLRAEVA